MADKRGSPMDMGSAMRDDGGGDEAGSGGSTGVRTAETLLRLLPMGLCIVALVFLTYIILAAGAVSMEVVYLAYKGDEAVTWSEACGSFGGFCRRSIASVAITFAAVLCYAALSLISSYRLFSKYDAPPVHGRSITKGIEIGATFHG
ncbi:hypothetical protein C3L33_10120, partial [Rhododendron williamsianum]